MKIGARRFRRAPSSNRTAARCHRGKPRPRWLRAGAAQAMRYPTERLIGDGKKLDTSMGSWFCNNCLIQVCLFDIRYDWLELLIFYQVTGLLVKKINFTTPQIAYRVTAYRVDSAYRVGFTWNQIILGIFVVRTDLILGRYSVAYRVDWKTKIDRLWVTRFFEIWFTCLQMA